MKVFYLVCGKRKLEIEFLIEHLVVVLVVKVIVMPILLLVLHDVETAFSSLRLRHIIINKERRRTLVLGSGRRRGRWSVTCS